MQCVVTCGIIALMHDSFQAAVGFGVSSTSKSKQAILNSLALQASTFKINITNDKSKIW